MGDACAFSYNLLRCASHLKAKLVENFAVECPFTLVYKNSLERLEYDAGDFNQNGVEGRWRNSHLAYCALGGYQSEASCQCKRYSTAPIASRIL